MRKLATYNAHTAKMLSPLHTALEHEVEMLLQRVLALSADPVSRAVDDMLATVLNRMGTLIDEIAENRWKRKQLALQARDQIRFNRMNRRIWMRAAYILTGQPDPYEGKPLPAMLDSGIKQALADRAEVVRLRAELAHWEESAAMACENPPPGCECPGCGLARDRAEASR